VCYFCKNHAADKTALFFQPHHIELLVRYATAVCTNCLQNTEIYITLSHINDNLQGPSKSLES